MMVKLVPLKATEGSQEAVLKKRVTILGRGRWCAIRIRDPMASRRHCKLTVADARATVRDLGSANGTYVNGTRVHETELKDGDVLTIGRHEFAVQMEAAAAEPAAAADQTGRTPGPAPAKTEELGRADPSPGGDPTEVLFRQTAGVPDALPEAPAPAAQADLAGLEPATEEVSEGPAEAALLAALVKGPRVTPDQPAADAESGRQDMSAEDQADLLAALSDIAARDARAADQPPEPAGRTEAAPKQAAPLDQLLQARDDSIYEESPGEKEPVDLDEDIAAMAAELRLVRQEMEQELRTLAPETTPQPPAPAEKAEPPAERAVPDLDEELPEGRPSLRPIFERDEGREEAAAARQADRSPEDNPALAPSHGLPRRDGDGAAVDLLGEVAEEPTSGLGTAAPGPPADESVVDVLGEAAAEAHAVDDDGEPLAEAPVSLADDPAATDSAPPVSVPIEPCTSPHPTQDVDIRVDRPLHEGARKGERGLVSLFLTKGANVNARAGRHHATALHYASGKGHVLVVEFLLARGADVNALDDLGATPLYWAKLLGHDEVVKSLLAAGADPNVIQGVEAP